LRRAAEVLDFGQSAAVMPLGVLHLIRDSEDPRGIVARLMERGPDFLSALQGGDSRLSRRFPAWLGMGFLLRCAAPGLLPVLPALRGPSPPAWRPWRRSLMTVTHDG
jgi:hypothetical protein